MKRTIYALFLFVSAGALSQTLDKQLADCRIINDATKRLVCYDNIAKPATPVENPRPVEALTESASVKQVEAQSRTDERVKNFGLEQKIAAEQELDEKLYSTISELKTDLRKKLILQLENGQVWRQSDSQIFRVKEGDKIYLERGALGSFFLGKEGINKRIRVKRIS
ncbi:MAG: type VI secretion protein [Paraglaciecola sp.]|nr:type VI secretion protein [Paraglaciecola sp.]